MSPLDAPAAAGPVILTGEAVLVALLVVLIAGGAALGTWWFERRRRVQAEARERLARETAVRHDRTPEERVAGLTGLVGRLRDRERAGRGGGRS